MSGTQTTDLMSVATDTSLRIHERIEIIKGSDKTINSLKEARAILAIPSKDLVWTDGVGEFLSRAKLQANDYIYEHEKQLKEKQKIKNDQGLLKKGAKILNTVNQGLKAFGQVLSFADKIKRGVPIYF